LNGRRICEIKQFFDDQKKSFFAHHARLDDSDEEDFEGVLKN